jgi:ATP-dependent DNA helicase DinG
MTYISAGKLLSDEARRAIRAAIVDAGGNEVFFFGRVDAGGIVREVEVFARGREDSVPALIRMSEGWDVALHNHPEGPLMPSPADIDVAAELGDRSVGFYVIDNTVERVYVVVRPFEKEELQLLDPGEIEAIFREGGLISRVLDGYEERPEQSAMALAVAEAFNENRVTIIEAGTGTGKSMAYLIPALLWAKRNREKVVLSTNTINLQEQLVKKDIPQLRGRIGFEFRAVLMKGRSNYVCLRKVEEIPEAGRELFETDDERKLLMELVQWAKQSRDGSKSALATIPSLDTWEKICCEHDKCLGVRCAHYADCFFFKARREASRADILVVNHHLLFADLAVRKQTGGYTGAAVIPAYKRLVIDEAHNIEEVASSYFGNRITSRGFKRLLGMLQSARRAGRGVLPHLRSRLQKAAEGGGAPPAVCSALAFLVEEVLPGRKALLRRAQASFVEVDRTVRDRMPDKEADSVEIKYRIRKEFAGEPFWLGMKDLLEDLRGPITRFAGLLSTLHKLLENAGDVLGEILSSAVIELQASQGRLESTAATLEFFLQEAEESHVRWIELVRRRREVLVRLVTAPLEVADDLRQSLYAPIAMVVLTSATLTVGGSFEYLSKRIGLEPVPEERKRELCLPSSFDFKRNVVLGIPLDIPEPGDDMFVDVLPAYILESLKISRGRAFVLFTSYGLLNRMHRELAGEIARLGLLPLKQGEENRHRLLQRFRTMRGSVLFGTDSFWEGVDVKGDALMSVVITRLPFKVPTEPLQEARVERIQEEGGNPFMEYTVPQAVLKLRQGFGRLVRSRTDKGAILILDRRVVTRHYGRIFLRSLPEVAIVRGRREEVFGAIQGRIFANNGCRE